MISKAATGFKPFIKNMWTVENAIHRKRNLGNLKSNPIRIAGIDPGTLSGLAQIWVSQETGRVLGHIETILAYDEQNQARDMVDWLQKIFVLSDLDCNRMGISIEDFKVNKVNGDEEFLSPVRIGRRVEGMLMATGRLDEEIRWQMPARKAEFTDSRLQALGMYTPGPDHRRDATRHALIGRKYALEKRGM